MKAMDLILAGMVLVMFHDSSELIRGWILASAVLVVLIANYGRKS